MNATQFTFIFALLLLIPLDAAAQQAPPPAEDDIHTVPFGAQDNRLEIIIQNSLGEEADVLVQVTDVPEWVELYPERVRLDGVEASSDATATFHFSVAEDAPVGEAETLKVKAFLANGTSLVEETVRLQASAPAEFRFVGAYPNPLSARTGGTATVAYELPRAADVEVVVYDVLGRQVAVLLDERQAPGRQAATWEAQDVSSGTYVWRLTVEGEEQSHVEQGQLTVIR